MVASLIVDCLQVGGGACSVEFIGECSIFSYEYSQANEI
jgi:hypothetical protein